MSHAMTRPRPRLSQARGRHYADESRQQLQLDQDPCIEKGSELRAMTMKYMATKISHSLPWLVLLVCLAREGRFFSSLSPLFRHHGLLLHLCPNPLRQLWWNYQGRSWPPCSTHEQGALPCILWWGDLVLVLLLDALDCSHHQFRTRQIRHVQLVVTHHGIQHSAPWFVLHRWSIGGLKFACNPPWLMMSQRWSSMVEHLRDDVFHRPRPVDGPILEVHGLALLHCRAELFEPCPISIATDSQGTCIFPRRVGHTTTSMIVGTNTHDSIGRASKTCQSIGRPGSRRCSGLSCWCNSRHRCPTTTGASPSQSWNNATSHGSDWSTSSHSMATRSGQPPPDTLVRCMDQSLLKQLLHDPCGWTRQEVVDVACGNSIRGPYWWIVVPPSGDVWIVLCIFFWIDVAVRCKYHPFPSMQMS